MDKEDENAILRLTPDQAIDMLETITESVVEFMKCYDSPDSRRLVNSLRAAGRVMRATQCGAAGRDTRGCDDIGFGEECGGD